MRRVELAGILLIVMAIAGCTSSNSDSGVVPTIASLDTLPTALFLTENAPPPGFGVVNFDPIDFHLSEHQGWTYQVTGSFEGTFDDSGQPAQGQFDVQVQSNEPGQQRRVVLQVQGSAFLQDAALLRLEGVRWSNDYYLVDVNGRCTVDQGGQMGGSAIGDLSAGQLIGGVKQAVPTGHRMDIAGIPAWQYTFAREDMRVPAIHQGPNSTVALEADLWIAPQINAVLTYEVKATVQKVHILWVDQATASPVSGTLSLRYELTVSQLDVLPNISVPHGC
jgi:hypothetical protein